MRIDSGAHHTGNHLPLFSKWTTCTGCGATNVVGALVVYKHGMGTVIRCPSCENVLIRVAQTKGQYWLDMRGVRVLQISAEA